MSGLSKLVNHIVKRAMPRRSKRAAQEASGETMSRIRQEFYCNACVGYFFANLNVALEQSVTVICPNCGHEHSRHTKAGVLHDGAHPKNRNSPEEILTTKATYSKTSRVAAMMGEADKAPYRNGVPFDAERWAEMAARQQGEID